MKSKDIQESETAWIGKESRISTPYGYKNWTFIKRVLDTHGDLVDELAGILVLAELNGAVKLSPESWERIRKLIKRADGK